MSEIQLSGPYTFAQLRGFRTIWSAAERFQKGVYLWCIAYENAFLVNYVGKTWCAGGFETRLWTEHQNEKNGLHCSPVDIEMSVRGVRIEVGKTRDELREQFALLQPRYRLFLAPLGSDARTGSTSATIECT